MVYTLSVYNYFGTGTDHVIHETYESAEDEALGRGKWEGDRPSTVYVISGPFVQAPPISELVTSVLPKLRAMRNSNRI